MSFLFFNPPPPSHPPNLHSHFYECGNLSCDTAEIRLGNSVRIVLDMVLVAPIWGRRTAIWTLGTPSASLRERHWALAVPRPMGSQEEPSALKPSKKIAANNYHLLKLTSYL